MDTTRSRATSGRMPMMTNSVVPMAKAARANARIGSGSREVSKETVMVRSRLLSLGGLERLTYGRQQFLAGERLWKHFSHAEPVRCFGRSFETAPKAPRHHEDGCSMLS